MLSHILSASSLQNHSGAAQAGQNSGASTGPSFASMLNTEMTAAAPAAATPAAPAPHAKAPGAAAPGAAAPAAAAATPPSAAATPTPAPATPQADSTTSPAKAAGPNGQDSNDTAGSTATEVKKPGKTSKSSDTAQTDSATQAAAATAATLAAVAAGVSVTNAAAKSAGSAAAGVSNAAQLNSLAGTSSSPGLQNTGLAGAAGKPGSKTGPQSELLTNQVQPGSSGIAPLTLNAVGAKPAASNGNSGKDNSPEQNTAAFNKALDASGAAAAKTGAAPVTALPTATTAATAAALSAQLSPVPVDTLAQNIKTANQDLSSAQMSAMAPILTPPNANVQNISASDSITPQVGSPAWDQAIGQKINWMVAGAQQTATLTLNPPNLGPMQIVLSVNNQHASATFIAQQPEVRAALEHAIPKLREMMEQSGIQLGQCNVNSQAQQQQQQQASSSRSSRGTTDTSAVSRLADVASSQSGQMTVSRSGNGLVDTFV